MRVQRITSGFLLVKIKLLVANDILTVTFLHWIVLSLVIEIPTTIKLGY